MTSLPKAASEAKALAAAPKGFYGQLEKGQVPAWLERVDLGPDSPLKLWRVKK